MNKATSYLTQEEVNDFLEKIHDAEFIIDRHHLERRQRIGAIAGQLANTDSNALDQIERILGMQPFQPRKLSRWERWWARPLLMLVVTTMTFLMDFGLALSP